MPGDQTRQRTDLGARHFRQRFAFAANAAGQDHEVVHRAAETNANHQPQQSRQKTKLRRQHRTNQRTGAGDRREVMAEQHPLVCRVIVVTVVHRLRRHGARIVKREHLGGDESGVVAIGDRDHAKRADDDWKCVHDLQFSFSDC